MFSIQGGEDLEDCIRFSGHLGRRYASHSDASSTHPLGRGSPAAFLLGKKTIALEGAMSVERAMLMETTPNRGRDAHYWAPPAQNRTCGFPAYGSHLGCLAAKRCCGQGGRILGLGSQWSASLATRSHVRSSLWLRRRSVRRHRSRTWKRNAARARPLVGTPW